MNCINTKSKEFQELLEASKLPSLLLEMRIAKWQEINGLESFPKVEDIIQSNEVNYQKNQTISNDGIIASEKTIRDLAAKIADRIGMKVVFESDRSKDYKGKIENNVAYVNLAYATLDTPIHEILGHPIIRAIKDTRKGFLQEGEEITDIDTNKKYILKKITEDFDFVIEENGKDITVSPGYFSWKTNTNSVLYNNLLKELETGIGKEVLDRVKRDYNVKYQINPHSSLQENKYGFELRHYINILVNRAYTIDSIIELVKTQFPSVDGEYMYFNYPEYEPEFYGDEAPSPVTTFNEVIEALDLGKEVPYTLEEQQEEALVELLGMMTAEKLDKVKDGKLISLLKRLLKEMKQFVRSLLNQKEVEIDKLPDNMTINDLADLLAYSNSKLILPGYEVEYTTPDNNKFKTYQEASNHISELAKSVEDVDFSNITVPKGIPDNFTYIDGNGDKHTFNKINENEYEHIYSTPVKNYNRQILDKERYVNTIKQKGIYSFIEKNKEYEQSKEIIEEWKKVNNIQYNPEEIYSRGQEFSSVVGAYSSFDVDLMMQNLLSHIEDNEKAGGKFAISAYTKPIDRQIGHLEGGGGKIKFKLYPQSNDILWAANTDVYSGSVWDASEKVNKDKKSELLGVSYTKYPSLNNVKTVQPNLASIVEDLSHHHNELAVSLNFSNFEIEVDEDVPYQTKKIIENVNKILQQKRLEQINDFINKLEKEC